jgi:hypothetical protein
VSGDVAAVCHPTSGRPFIIQITTQGVLSTAQELSDGARANATRSHEFQVVSKSFDVTSNDTTINPPLEEGQSNPSRRDTITIPPTGNVVLRWRADNPGAWFFHCHIDWHLSSKSARAMSDERVASCNPKTHVHT